MLPLFLPDLPAPLQPKSNFSPSSASLSSSSSRSQRQKRTAQSKPAFVFPRKRRSLEPVDKEKLDSESEPVSSEAAAVEYVRTSTRQFFVNRSGRHRRGGALYREGDNLTVREKALSKTWRGRFVDRLKRLAFPEGYPQSVGPGFVEYTRWRLSAFFWGGAVGVFSTQGLLLAVGVGRQSAAPLAAALQWVIRDGMGRAGRMLFSQVGNGFDAETKQYRLMAALVLNLSCALESVTPAVPHLFLPLACIANMAKGASTVAAASTRSAIYRSFMRRENLGDITAKQETVGVAGDLMGTAMGILLSRATAGSRRLATTAFLTVSLAHLFSAYREIKGIQLATLNRQRAHMLIKHYLEEGKVPNLRLGNSNERIVNRPWLDSLHAPNIDLGARLQECAPDAEALQYLLRLYKNERYLFTYENARMKIVLRNDAKSHDCLKAFLQADYFWNRYKQVGIRESRNRELVEDAYKFANSRFDSFAREAQLNGWLTNSVLLRPIGRRASWNSSMPSSRR
ncbi:Protein root UVB sensitive 6 [Gracilariopsis chorda]|uniref:Protein root UVB sensitive 6 n=1 Tax=Gracilariopsis chorda TaxID=448386 RepID=A0A2V3IRV9_9FLOR|nr:Protein root UVB sensitive 6 [Gracilariopsis chorda]|eukprot:PXF44866.1 Protein root UVB sensitive 6 [Gracilariopsis chorda]